jgi:uncharacterized protein YjaZ
MNWLRTDKTYRRILAQTDLAVRERIFRDELLEPVRPALTFYNPLQDEADLLEVARMWFFAMPEDLDDMEAGLRLLETGGAWAAGEEALARAIERFAPYADRVHVETDVTGAIVLTRPSPVSSYGGGYAGVQMPGCVLVTYDRPDEANVRHAPGAVAHEFNHRVRLTAYPWDMSTIDVAEYVVMEGLAESFAVALYGEEVLGYYVTQISDEDLQTARALVRDGLTRTGFDVIRGYLFGDGIANDMGGFGDGMSFDAVGMPTFGGYAVGYHIVQAYLRATGASIEEATLTPAHVIAGESGYLAS